MLGRCPLMPYFSLLLTLSAYMKVMSNKIYGFVLTRSDKHQRRRSCSVTPRNVINVWLRSGRATVFNVSLTLFCTNKREKRTCSRFHLKLRLRPASEYILHHLHISFVNIIGALSKTINDLILELPLHSPGNRVDHSIEETTYFGFRRTGCDSLYHLPVNKWIT